MNLKTSIATPQCNSTADDDLPSIRGGDASIGNLKVGDCKPTDRFGIEHNNVGNGCLNSFSDDVLLSILLYCGPTDVEENLKLVNHRLQ